MAEAQAMDGLQATQSSMVPMVLRTLAVVVVDPAVLTSALVLPLKAVMVEAVLSLFVTSRM